MECETCPEGQDGLCKRLILACLKRLSSVKTEDKSTVFGLFTSHLDWKSLRWMFKLLISSNPEEFQGFLPDKGVTQTLRYHREMRPRSSTEVFKLWVEKLRHVVQVAPIFLKVISFCPPKVYCRRIKGSTSEFSSYLTMTASALHRFACGEQQAGDTMQEKRN